MWYHWLVGILCVWSLVTYVYRRVMHIAPWQFPAMGDILWMFACGYGIYFAYQGITAPAPLLGARR